MIRESSKSRWIILFLALIIALSCSLPSSAPESPTGIPGLEQTQDAISLQETSISMQQTALVSTEQQQQQNILATKEAENQALIQTLTAIAIVPTEKPAAGPTNPPLLLSPATEQAPPAVKVVDMADRILGSNVLLYEDMAGNLERYRLVQRAVNNIGFSGGRVVDVADRDGDFKAELIGSTNWDLIIVATEERSGIQGEFWGYIHDHLKRDTAVIIEAWNLDQHYTDIAPLFSDCGIAFQQDWKRPEGYNVVNYVIYILEPNHDFFLSAPHKNVNLGNPNFLYWVPPRTTDCGDIIRLSTGGDATLLAGITNYDKSRHGVLATCMEGRLIVQTFATHDYKESEVVNLWENYIAWTLTNHYTKVDQK